MDNVIVMNCYLIQSDFGNYSGDEDIQGFCLEITITERALLKGHNCRHLLITASLEASRGDDCQAPPSVFVYYILCPSISTFELI